MDYLLDTNACIALNKGKPASVRIRFDKTVHAGMQVWVPAVVLYELWYGVAKSAPPKENAEYLATFLAGPVRGLGFEEGDGKVAGTVGPWLERVGGAKVEVVGLLTDSTMYTFCDMLSVWLAPNCSQFTPSLDPYILNTFPLLTSLSQYGSVDGPVNDW